MKKRRRLRAGTQLLEVLLFVAIAGMVISLLAELTVSMSSLTQVTSLDASIEDQSRHQLDNVIQDVTDSSIVLQSYTGQSTYTTDTSTTLVLQAPSYNASGNILGTNDVIVYYLSGTSAPYSLHRIVAAAPGSQRSSSADKVVSSNVQSMAITYLVSQNFTGDGTTKAFTLSAFPGGPSPVGQVTVNALAVALGTGPGQAQFVSPNTLHFTGAPAKGATINALYSVDPSAYASAVTGVNLDCQMSVSGPQLGPAATQTVEVASQANLENH